MYDECNDGRLHKSDAQTIRWDGTSAALAEIYFLVVGSNR